MNQQDQKFKKNKEFVIEKFENPLMNILKKNIKNENNNNKEIPRRINLEATLQKDLKEQLEDENQLLRVENY